MTDHLYRFIQEHVIKRAPSSQPFELKHGRRQQHYFDFTELPFYPQALQAMANQVVPLLEPRLRHIGCIRRDEVALLSGILQASAIHSPHLRGFCVEVPEFAGLEAESPQPRISGPVPHQGDVALFKPFVSQGDSTLSSITALTRQGVTVRQVIALVADTANTPPALQHLHLRFTVLHTPADFKLPG